MKKQSKNRQERVQKIQALVGRLEKFLAFKGETFNELTKSLELSGSYFSASKRGDGIIGTDVTMMILEHHRDLSPDWLLFGSGAMLRGGTAEEQKVISTIARKSKIDKQIEASIEKTKKLKGHLQKLLISTDESLSELTKLQT